MIQTIKFSAYMNMEPGQTFYIRDLAGKICEQWDVLDVRRFDSGGGEARIKMNGYKDTSKI